MAKTLPRMINPYQTPAFDAKQFQDQPGYMPAAAANFGWVSQVRTFAILNIVQGVLEVPLGVFLTGLATMFPVLIKMDQAKNANGAQDEPGMIWMVSGIYFVIGIPVLVCGILRIVAGVKNYRFRGRTLSLISIIAGAASVMTCYCAPTSLGLLVYGLTLHLNPAVKMAFEMGRQGKTADQILAAFTLYQPGYYPPPFGPPGQMPAGESPFGAESQQPPIG